MATGMRYAEVLIHAMCDTHGPDIAHLRRYLVGSNDKLGRLQEKALRRLVAMYRNPGERVGDHGITREACLQALRRMVREEWPSRWRRTQLASTGDTAGHRWLFGMCI